jgi:hypothetical protein
VPSHLRLAFPANVHLNHGPGWAKFTSAEWVRFKSALTRRAHETPEGQNCSPVSARSVPRTHTEIPEIRKKAQCYRHLASQSTQPSPDQRLKHDSPGNEDRRRVVAPTGGLPARNKKTPAGVFV